MYSFPNCPLLPPKSLDPTQLHPSPLPVQCDIGTQSLSTSPTSNPVPLSTLPLTAVTTAPPLTLPCYQGNKHQFPGLHSYVIMLLCFYLTVYGQHVAVAATGFDATGREIGFFPKAMMLAKDPKALILYQDTTLVSLHMDLNLASRIKFPDLNSTCDPVLSKFYTHVLDSLRGIQRTVTRLSSIHGVTDLFECDSYLRRFYTYVSGFTSTLNCPTRHYANSLHACKSWAIRACKILTPGERAWLKERNKRSSYWCHAGLAGVPRFFYMLGGGKCESSSYSNLIQVLFEFSKTMSEAHNLVKNLNGKIVYLVKTTDLVNSKVTQVIASLRLISRAFSVLQKQVSSFASKVTCHCNMQQEFTSLFAMEVNKTLTSLLRLTEVDLLRQIAHLTKRNLIGYADLPRFLTEEISLKLSSVDTLAPAIDALKNGFSVILNPLVDTKFPSQRKLQMHFLFLLPVLVSLNKVYNSLVQDFTRHLTKLNSDIASVKEVPDSGISDTLVYFSLALTVFDLIIVLVFYCVLSKRVSVPRTTSAATSV